MTAGAEKSARRLRPEKPWFRTEGPGFDSRHLHDDEVFPNKAGSLPRIAGPTTACPAFDGLVVGMCSLARFGAPPYLCNPHPHCVRDRQGRKQLAWSRPEYPLMRPTTLGPGQLSEPPGKGTYGAR